jgi:hypothetical protein
VLWRKHRGDAPDKDGTIRPQLVMGCDDHLNRALLMELKRIDEQQESTDGRTNSPSLNIDKRISHLIQGITK